MVGQSLHWWYGGAVAWTAMAIVGAVLGKWLVVLVALVLVAGFAAGWRVHQRARRMNSG